MDEELFREYVGIEPSMTYIDHAGRGGLIAWAGVEFIEQKAGSHTPIEDLNGELAGILKELLGVRGTAELSLCWNPVSAIESVIAGRGIVYEYGDPPPFRVEACRNSECPVFHSVVNPFTGAYKPFIDCRRGGCILDLTYTLGVREIPQVEGEFMAYAFFDKWLMTPGKTGLLLSTQGIHAPDCQEPSPLILLYVYGVVRYLAEKGFEWVKDRILGLTYEYGWLLDKAGYTPFTPPEDEYRAGILTFPLRMSPEEAYRLAARLEDLRVYIGFHGYKAVSLSPNIYNTVNDIDALLRLLP